MSGFIRDKLYTIQRNRVANNNSILEVFLRPNFSMGRTVAPSTNCISAIPTRNAVYFAVHMMLG